jgi:hypothetical protein
VQDPTFLRLTTVQWEGIATIATAFAAAASVASTVIVAFVAKFTFEYMKSTKELVSAAQSQSDASVRQAEASIKTLELMRIERIETDSFQRAVFAHSTDEIVAALNRYCLVVGSSTKPWNERDCELFPNEWDICRSFVSRKAPHLLGEMQFIEKELNEACNQIQSFIRAPDSLWLSTVQRRITTTSYLSSLQRRISKFQQNALKPE